LHWSTVTRACLPRLLGQNCHYNAVVYILTNIKARFLFCTIIFIFNVSNIFFYIIFQNSLTITFYKLTASTRFWIMCCIYMEHNGKEQRKHLKYNKILKLEINYTLVAVPGSAWTNLQTVEVVYVRAIRSLTYLWATDVTSVFNLISECHVRTKSISNAANRNMHLSETFGVIFMFGIILIKRIKTIN
jgi:hypothetical protein